MKLILMLLGVVVVYLIVAFIYRKNWSRDYNVDVSFEKDHVVKGDTINLIEVITNAKKLPLPYVNIKFEIDRSFLFNRKDTNSNVTDKTYRNDIFSLLSNQKITRKIPVVCSRRGVYGISNVETIFSGIFMNEIMVYRVPSRCHITVYPKAADVNLLQVFNNRMLGEVERKKFLLEDKFVFAGIRDYQTYDSMRDINWKASARTDNLMVNQYNETMSRNVCLLLNLESDGMLKLDEVSEESISIASGMAQMLLSMGINVSVVSNGCDLETKNMTVVDGGSGIAHLNQINSALSRIDLNVSMKEFADILNEMKSDETFDENVVYVLISASRRKNLQEVAERYFSNQQEKLWILPYAAGMENSLDYCNIIPQIWEVKR